MKRIIFALVIGLFGSVLRADDNLPNIIYIMADDLGYGDLSCFGQTKFETPNIDSLAKEGVTFTNYYAGSTVCAPTRCVLMTGMQHAYIKWVKQFAVDKNKKNEKFFRIINEVPTALMIIIVIMVIVQPF